MPAPCCEFHLSRKTSGDCYANGYGGGTCAGEKGKKMVMFGSLWVRGVVARGGKKKRVEGTDWGREKGERKQSKERRNKNGGWEETNKDGVNVDGRVWQDAAWNVCLQELSQRSTLGNKSEFSLCACVCVHMHAYRHHARVAFKWKVFVCFCIICPHLSVYLSVAAKRQKRHTHTQPMD